MQTRRKRAWVSPLVRRSAMKRRLGHLYRSVPSGLCLPSGQLPGFFFHTWATLGPSSGMQTHPSAKMDLEVKASGRSKTHYGLELSPDFWLQGAFLHECSVSLTLYSDKVFPLCPCRDYSVETFAGDKDWLSTLFLLLLPFLSANRGWL